jgi:hypothetical protein
MGRSSRKQVDVLRSICPERVKNTVKIFSIERWWKIEMGTDEFPNGKHFWMATRRYYLTNKHNKCLLLQADSGEKFSNVHFQPRTAVAQWLRYCATNRKVADSISDGVMGFCIDINPSDRTIALGSTQPLTEMNARSISWR